MSAAGARSSRGDEYQLRVALHWIIQMLEGDSIDYVQAESLGAPGDSAVPAVDDIVVCMEHGARIYIQAKKNETNSGIWRFSNTELKKELKNAFKQLESDSEGKVRFYSQSPFGEFAKLVEGVRDYASYVVFDTSAPGTLKKALQKLSAIVKRTKDICFDFCWRIGFGPLHTMESWDEVNFHALQYMFARPMEAQAVLERMIGSHQARLRDPKVVLRKEEVLKELEKAGHPRTLRRNEGEILAAFRRASANGRDWPRDIAGHHIKRNELATILTAIEDDKQRILLVDSPGTGKTCILLDLV